VSPPGQPPGECDVAVVGIRTERAVHVRNAPSPAATSALPLARLIADELAATMQV
jgi:hypothetical protein